MATPESLEGIPGPALMLGGFGFRRSSMEEHLIHGTRHAVWHDDWSNDQHDDIVIVIARMLKWQLLPQQERPFHGRNLYALIAMGRFNLLLDGLPYDQDGQLTRLLPNMPGWRSSAAEVASKLAEKVHDSLSDAEQKEFDVFQQKYMDMFVCQMERRKGTSI